MSFCIVCLVFLRKVNQSKPSININIIISIIINTVINIIEHPSSQGRGEVVKTFRWEHR